MLRDLLILIRIPTELRPAVTFQPDSAGIQMWGMCGEERAEWVTTDIFQHVRTSHHDSKHFSQIIVTLITNNCYCSGINPMQPSFKNGRLTGGLRHNRPKLL